MEYLGSNRDFLINTFDSHTTPWPYEHKEYHGWDRINYFKENRKTPFVQNLVKSVVDNVVEKDYLEGLDTPEFNDDMEDMG